MPFVRSFLFALAFLPFASPASAGERTKAAAPPNDRQIAAIVLAANTNEVNAGDLAVDKTANNDIKTFAQAMVKDHSSVKEGATTLYARLGIKPQASAASLALLASGTKSLRALKKLSGTKFDAAYVRQAVGDHVDVLQTIDDVLLPNAKNDELKAFLVSIRQTVAAHLEHARTLQKSLTDTLETAR